MTTIKRIVEYYLELKAREESLSADEKVKLAALETFVKMDPVTILPSIKSLADDIPEKAITKKMPAVPPTPEQPEQPSPDVPGVTFGEPSAPAEPADVPGVTFEWVDISATGTPIFLGDDRSVGPVGIGFPFNFYDTDWTGLYINSNGFLSFGGGAPGAYKNDCIPNASPPNDLEPPTCPNYRAADFRAAAHDQSVVLMDDL